MTQYHKLYILIAAILMIAAVILMIDDHVLGEMTTNLSRVLLVTAIPVIAKSRKERITLETEQIHL